MVNLITNNLTIVYALKRLFFSLFSVFDRNFYIMKNHASLDQMSDPQLTKHFLGVILRKIWWLILVMPFAATGLYALILPFLDYCTIFAL
jgi:hypothetical protein